MKFSIIIPVYNDPVLEQCLASISALNYPSSDYEVIVVENGASTTTVQDLVAQFGFSYANEPVLGSYQARNTGLRLAKGDWLVFTDSDCTVSLDWLNVIAVILSDAEVSGIMGYSAGAPSTKVANYEQRMYEANIANFTHEPRLRRIDTRNFAMKRSLYETIGGFTATLGYGGDMEYGARAHHAGLRIAYESGMMVTHHNAKQLQPLLKKRIRQNYGNMSIVQLHDPKFVREYFPHLLRYQANTATVITWYLLNVFLWLQLPVADIICQVLPKQLGYTYFKTMNVLAMRYGQISFVLNKQPLW